MSVPAVEKMMSSSFTIKINGTNRILTTTQHHEKALLFSLSTVSSSSKEESGNCFYKTISFVYGGTDTLSFTSDIKIAIPSAINFSFYFLYCSAIATHPHTRQPILLLQIFMLHHQTFCQKCFLF